jgi:phosphopantothenoylcysteine synthetase/decarboxylase
VYVIACGGPPAGQVTDFAQSAQGRGWDVCVIATPDGAKFLDTARLAELTGHPVRVHYKQPDEPDVLPRANAMVVAPATFSTVNKLAHGISDTLALGLLNEAIGMRLPIIVVPWPNVYLARHPAFVRSIAELRDWGITLVYDPANLPDAGPEPAVFPWEELRAALAKLDARS